MQLDIIVNKYPKYAEYLANNYEQLLLEFEEIKAYYDLEKLQEEIDSITPELNKEDVDLNLIRQKDVIDEIRGNIYNQYYRLANKYKKPNLNAFFQDTEPWSTQDTIKYVDAQATVASK